MKKIQLTKDLILKSTSINENIHSPDIKDQKTIINNYFMNILDKKTFICVTKELKKKLNGYKQQDIKKDKYNPETFLNIEDLVDKLVGSKLKCYYCKTNVRVLYDYARDPVQWTLDRKDNSIGHSNSNTVICCLKCNLQRRTQNIDKFMFTKNLKIMKTN